MADRGTTSPGRRPLSFAVSGCLHGCLLGWVILSGTGQPQQRTQSIYDREIRPNEKKIVWYSLREKLPEIAPADTQADARPPRARKKAAQAMVAGARDDARPAPLIWAPELEVAAPKEMPLPNVVAVAAPKVVRPFVAPPAKSAMPPPVAPLPEAPRGVGVDRNQRSGPQGEAAVAALIGTPAAPKVVRPFVAPPAKSPGQTSTAALKDAPGVADVKTVLPLPLEAPSGPRRAFTPPPSVRMQRQAMLPVAEGPTPVMVIEPNALPFANTAPTPQPRAFVAPAAKRRVLAEVALPAAPEVAGVSAKQRTGPQGGTTVASLIGTPQVMRVVAPVISAGPPAVPRVPGATAEASLAIVGLNPAKTAEVPAPPVSRAAGFSAGPEARAEGGQGADRGALLSVPGLVVQGGGKDRQPTLMANLSPTSRENLLAARSLVAGSKAAVEPRAPRVSEAPDPRFAGRVVYAIAIQMPNITSFSGSWLVWFAEREPLPGAAPPQMRPPEVVRKVDPKYIAAAAADRVEGTVRLFGVIRKDGHVSGISLLRQLDERLDRSAREALAKWEFVPALRDGVPVDVDAIFEIPFHLAPRLNH